MAILRGRDFGAIGAGERCAISLIIAHRKDVRKTGESGSLHRRWPDRGGPENGLGRGVAFTRPRRSAGSCRVTTSVAAPATDVVNG